MLRCCRRSGKESRSGTPQLARRDPLGEATVHFAIWTYSPDIHSAASVHDTTSLRSLHNALVQTRRTGLRGPPSLGVGVAACV